MNVIDRGFHSFGREQVTIKTRALLPEAKTEFAWAFANCQCFKQRRVLLHQHLLDRFGEWLFDSSEQAAHVGLCVVW